MNITSKGRYAIKIMMDLAHFAGESHVHRHDIARRQGIPADYLDQIMMRLRRSQLVISVRGRGGGYHLGRSAREVSVWDILAAVEDILYPTQCVESESSLCDFETACIAKDAWDVIFSHLKTSLASLSLHELVQQGLAEHKMCPAAGTRSCHAGSNSRELRAKEVR